MPTWNQNTTGTAANVTGTVAYGNGGTGITSTPANGQLLIGNGSGYSLSTLTAGSNVTITNTAGGITIAATGGGGGGSPAGSNTQVQYNNSGSFGASPNFTYSGTTLGIIGASGNVSTVINGGGLTLTNNLTGFGNQTTIYSGLGLSSGGFGYIIYTNSGANAFIFNPSGSFVSPKDGAFNNVTVGIGGGGIATNTVLGYQASINSNSSSGGNTAVGYKALTNSSSANCNTAVGYQAALNSTTNVLFLNGLLGGSGYTDGTYNNVDAFVISGPTWQTLPKFNVVISGGVATSCTLVSPGVGASTNASAVFSVSTSTIGSGTGFQITGNLFPATANTVVGYNALYSNTNGNSNVSVGYNTLYNNTTGSQNTSIGSQAGAAITSGQYNALLGYNSGYVITTGGNNVCLGYNSGNDALISITTSSNNVVLGNNSTTSLYCKTSTITTSDIRDKTNIRPITLGLSFVNTVNPIAYQFKTSRDDDTPASRTYLGWSAQNVLANQGSENIVDQADPENLKMAGMDMVAVLWNAVRELSAEVERLKAQ